MSPRDESLFHITPNAIARCRWLRASDGTVRDFQFIAVNRAFCDLTGSDSATVLNTTGAATLPSIHSMLPSDADTDFERYEQKLQCWVRVSARRLDSQHFALFLEDISSQRTVAELLEDFFHTHTSQLDYGEIAERFRRLTGAQAAAFHLRSANGSIASTVAACGGSELDHLKKLMLHKPLLHSTAQIGNLLQLFNGRDIATVPSLAALTPPEAPFAAELAELEKTVFSGEKLLALIRFAGNYIGHFTFIMPPTKCFSSYSMTEIFVREVGLLLTRTPEDEANDLTTKELIKFSRHMPGGIFRFRQAADGHYSFPLFSTQLTEITGIPVLLNDAPADLVLQNVHPEDYAGVLQSIRTSAETMKQWDCEFRITHPQKGARWLHGLSQPEKKPDGSIIWSGYITDVTDRKQYEQATLEAAKAAEDANQSKDQFIANVSHEIRTPLNGIVGMSQLLLQTNLNPQQQEYALLTQQSVLRLEQIVNDLLDFSRISHGNLSINYEPIQLKTYLRSITEPYRLLANQKDISFVHTIDTSLPESICSDPSRIGQILGNLLNNAVKFTDHGRIQLLADRQHQPNAEDSIVFTVRDTGIGFDRQTAAHLFTPFRQGEGSLARRYEGTGLGLSIANELAGLLQGSLTATSSPGKGAEFVLTIPLLLSGKSETQEEPTRQPHPNTQDNSAHSPLRIMAADDDKINQKVMAHFIERMGFEATLVDNGRQAIETLQHSTFDVVLMDVQMPEMDGSEATKRIRAGEAGDHNRDIPIIAVTAHVHRSELDSFIEDGMDDCAVKPLDTTKLKEQILHAAGKLRNQPPKGSAAPHSV